MKREKLADGARRQFPRGGIVASSGAVATVVMAAGVATAQTSPMALAMFSYPAIRLGNLNDIKINEPVDVTYPDANSPGILLKLGVKVDGGAGPDGDILACSVLRPKKSLPFPIVPRTRR